MPNESARMGGAARLAIATVVSLAALVVAAPAFSTTYYIDAASLGGRCSDANAGTSSSAPWCSLSKAGSAPSGSIVLVRRATYDKLSLAGESDLTVEGYPGERPTLANGILVSGRSLRVAVSRFRSTGLVDVRQSDRVVLADIEIDGNRFGVSGAHNVTVQDSWVHDVPPLLDKFGSFGVRVAPYGGERPSNVTIRRNRIENLSNDPVQLSYVATALVEDNVFRNAHPTGNGEHVDTIHVLGGSDIVLRRNDGRAMQHGLMITDRLPKDGPDADSRAMTIENNIVQTDVGYSFNGPPGPNSWVVNNTLISPWGTSVRYTDSRDTSGTTSAGAVFGNNVVKNKLGVASEIVENYNFADSGSRRGSQTIIGRVSFEGDYGLPAGSPAVDSASTAWAPPTDLNGYSRVGAPDRGAKERGGEGDSSSPPVPACDNGADDDGDGRVDYPNDPGCTDAGDGDETDLATSPPPPPPSSGVGPHELVRSVSATRSSPVLLEGATLSGNVYVFTDTADDHGGISKVEFRLDGALKRTENTAPYDYAGGSASTANAWDTRTVANGPHTIGVRVFHSDGLVETQEATFTVSN